MTEPVASPRGTPRFLEGEAKRMHADRQHECRNTGAKIPAIAASPNTAEDAASDAHEDVRVAMLTRRRNL